MVYDWRERLGDWLAPDRCRLCGDPARLAICSGCRDELPANHPACHRCALPLPVAEDKVPLCWRCQRRPPVFDRTIAPLRYEGRVAALMRAFKYQQQLSLGRLLGGLLAGAVVAETPLPGLLLPTPLHANRLRERGFNQAAELTRVLAGRLGLRWRTNRLLRVRDTVSQTGLDRRARRRALRDAFVWRGVVPCPSVAVVDDVITTGATAEQMARVLKRAGFERVEIWAVARTPQAPSPLPSPAKPGGVSNRPL